jgi:hypothetical protein
MMTWKNASVSDRKRYLIIAKLLESHPKLLEYLFHPKKAELSAPPEELLRNPYSGGEKILIQVAIDLWSSGSGGTQLMDLNSLDGTHLYRVIEAFTSIRRL